MDAWIVRRAAVAASPSSTRAILPPLPPTRQLVVRDCVQLLALATQDAAQVQQTIEAAGARVVHTDTDGDTSADAVVTLVVVGPTAARSAVDASTHKHPHAQLVTPAWVYATTTVRKEQDSGAVVSSADVHGVDDHPSSQNLAEPVRKKARLGVGVGVNVGVDVDHGRVDTVVVGAPTLSRAWETVDNGALHFLDARSDSTPSPPTNIDRTHGKLAAFDLDGTLIVTKSGKRFAQHADDWKLLDAARVPATLQRLAREGFTLAIISNQNGVAKGKTTSREVQAKMVAVVRRLNIPMLVLFATQDDEIRKPRIGAWRWLLQRLGIDVDVEVSLYCGDAAGRPKIAGRNKDFAATDYAFALNAGVQFFTPEALFFQSTQRVHTRPEMWEIGFDPRALPVSSGGSGAGGDRLDPPTTAIVRATQEIVVLVGPPASGKSHFATKFTNYKVVCQDDLKTVARCIVDCTQALEAGRSVVIDCTNRDPRGRKDWVALALKHSVPVRCFCMEVPKPLSMHLNTFRKLTTAKDIPDIAIHTFYKNYVSPQKAEGFEAIVKVRFLVDSEALSPAHRQLLLSFL